MSGKEKDILNAISEAIPKMSEFEKGYFLGVAECKAAEQKEKGTEKAG